MVEQEAVNFEVAGSSPVPGAMNKKDNPTGIIFLFISFSRTGREPALAGSTGRRSEQKSKINFRFFERGGTEGFCLSKILAQSRKPKQTNIL